MLLIHAALYTQVSLLSQNVNSLQTENDSLKKQLVQSSAALAGPGGGDPSKQRSGGAASSSSSSEVAVLSARLAQIEALLGARDDERAAAEFAKQMKKVEAAGIPMGGQGRAAPPGLPPGPILADPSGLPPVSHFGGKGFNNNNNRGLRGEDSLSPASSSVPEGCSYGEGGEGGAGASQADLNCTKRFSTAMPSDFKLAAQMEGQRGGNGFLPGQPKQFL